jgi:hypothetical protein
MRLRVIIAAVLLLGFLCSCSNDDPAPIEPVLQDGVADIVINGKIAGNRAALLCQ